MSEIVREALDLRSNDPWYTVEEAADYLRLTKAAVTALLRRNQLQASRSVTGRVRIRRSACDAYQEGGTS
jgi:excisionase family DNA binding protein